MATSRPVEISTAFLTLKTSCFDGNSILPRESSIADGMHYLVAVIKYFAVRNLHPFTLFAMREMVMMLC